MRNKNLDYVKNKNNSFKLVIKMSSGQTVYNHIAFNHVLHTCIADSELCILRDCN